MSFTVTVLGSGNAFQTDGRGTAAFLVQFEKCRFLVDCGPTLLVKAEMLKADLRNLEIVFLTHFHGDHAAGIPFLLLFMKYIEKREKPITIVGPPGTKEWVNWAIELCYPAMKFPFKIFFEELGKLEKLTRFYMLIETVPIQHTEDSLGYRFSFGGKTLAFSGDSKYTAELIRLTAGADLAFVECSTIHKLNTEHVSLEELKIQFPGYLAGAKKIVLIHLYNALAREIERLKLPVIPAQDGGVYTTD